MSAGGQRVGRIKSLLATPTGLRRGLNVWPPLLFTGIHVDEITSDYRRIRVRLRHTPFTSNYFGTLYGGSLFSMTDPFWAIMMLRNLGSGYVVWDAAGEITFVKAVRATVFATFELDQAILDEVRAATADGAKVLRWFETDLVTADGTLVARTRKQLHIRHSPA